MSEEYNRIKNNELKSTYADFSFSEEMQKASRNEMWKNKTGLWTLISGACDDAVRQCYEKINTLVDSLADVDTCNVHALKSIAKSVDLAYLCKNIKEDFPLDIANLIDLLSVPKHILLHSNRLLHPDANAMIEGEIINRASTVINDGLGYSIDLLYEIKKHIVEIREILNRNFIFTKRRLYDYDKDANQVSKFSLVSQEYYDYVKSLQNEQPNADIDDAFNRSVDGYINDIIKIDFQDLKNYQYGAFTKDGSLNPFFVLINVCKCNLVNKEYGFFLIPRYFNEQENIHVDLTALFSNIINSFEAFDEKYAEDFICYHFYNTIVSKIKNSHLGSYFNLTTNKRKITKTVTENTYHFVINDKGVNEFTEEEFYERVQQFLTSDEIDDFIYQKYPKVNAYNEKEEYSINDTDYFTNSDEFKVKINQNLNKHVIDFVEYVKLINSALNNSREYISVTFGIVLPEKIDYDILKINYSSYPLYQKRIVVDETYSYINNYDLILFGDDKHDGVIKRIAKELTDITTNISHIREQIKTSIQQYSFIGTRRIATDILRDFFVKNYSKKDEWNYISDILQKEDVNVSALFKPLSELLNSDQKFSIDVVEYYDNTKYLNIESDLPIVKTGTVIKEYEQRPSFWIDDHNLVTSGLVSAAVYEDVYAPCSVYINDYNKRFWGSVGKIITPSGIVDDKISLNANASDYDLMFGQYFSELNEFENENDRATLISSVMVPLFNKIWDTFALSALSENPDALGEMVDVYRKYLGTNEGTYQYENMHNKVFPTIAPLINVDNLVEVTNYINDVLFVAKAYYANVMPYVISSTKDMLKMHDEHGVPYEGWRQNYINFHGYSTNYEYAKNVSVFENEPKKIFEFDGPFSYSMLQKVIYENYMNEENADVKVSENTISSIVKYIDVSNSAVFMDAYNTYFNKSVLKTNKTVFSDGTFYEEPIEKSIPTYFVPSSEYFIGNYNIVKMEKDQYQNTYTLFKKCPIDEAKNVDKTTTAVSGVLFFRSNDMMISLPLMQPMIQIGSEDFIVNQNFSTDATIEIIRKMVNGCVDFGVISNFMWMFSEIEDDLNEGKTIYKFISFKFSEDDHHIIVDEDTVRFYTNTIESLDSRIIYLNDYIGSVYEPDKEHVDFLFSDWEEIMQSASTIKELIDNNETTITSGEYLFNGVTIPIYKIRLDILENKCEMMKIEADNCAMPMLLEHFSDHQTLDEPLHHIWSTNKYKNRCTICYEALNKEYDTSKFGYYFDFGASSLKYQVLEICFNNSNYYTNEKYNDNLNMSFSNKIAFSLYEETVMVKKDAIYDKLLNLCYTHPKCIIKNGNLIVRILPFALTSYGNIEKQQLFANSVAKNVYNLTYNDAANASSVISFSGVLKDFEDYFENAEAEERILNDSKTSLDFITGIIANDDNILSIAPLSGILRSDESINMSSSFEQANKIFESIPFVTNCMTEKLKVTVWFRNDTGITFIDDRAVDLDLTCYIDDPFEKDKKVGYWNKYIRTRYIEWTGDNPDKEHEELLIDVNKYLKDKRGVNEMKINLNLCWHDSSQIKTQDVYVMVNWQNVVENIPIHILGDVNKDCTTRSLSLLIHPDKNNTLTYELPDWYPVIKIAYKDEIVAYEDGIPDVQLGFLNLTQSELQKYQHEWFSVNYYEDELSGQVKFSAFRHNSKKFKTNNKEVLYVSYLINEPLFGDLDNIHLKSMIVDILSEHIHITSRRLNYVTKERFDYVDYTRMCAEELFFGPKVNNEDPETGVNMIYYGFLNPTFFKDDDTINNHTYPIEAAAEDMRMNYNVGYDYYYNSEAVSGLVQMILYTMSTGEYLDYENTDHLNLPKLTMSADEKELIDEYLHTEKNPNYSVYGFFKFMWKKLNTWPDESIDEAYKKYYPTAAKTDWVAYYNSKKE